MEKGRILEDLADRDPAQLDEAVKHWTDLRTRLQAVRAKRPEEYFEVIYRVAACLMRQADDAQDKAKAKDRAQKAEQLLTWALIEYPKLNSADAVARYQALRERPARCKHAQRATDRLTAGGSHDDDIPPLSLWERGRE